MSEKLMPVQILEWKSIPRNSLLGFAVIKLGALKIHDVAVHTSHGKYWAQLPAKPQVTSSGEVRKSPEGKIQYAKMLEWDTREASDRFSASVIAALKEAHPQALIG